MEICCLESCPDCCHASSTVYDSRPSPAGRLRRRRCDACGRRWKTIEVAGETVDRMILAHKILIEAHERMQTAVGALASTFKAELPGSTAPLKDLR